MRADAGAYPYLVAADDPDRHRSAVRLRPLTGRRILVTDDRDDIRLMLLRLLEASGARTDAARNGRGALERLDLAGLDAFDAVLMDMQMPDMDGFEATRRLRDKGYRRPVIALTAGAMTGERERCLAAGCTDYLSKPVDGRRLVELLLAHCRRHEGRGYGNGAAPAPSPAPPPAARLRVLIVEDSPDAADALARVLTRAGHTVRTAGDGAGALRAVREHRPDVALLDIQLPDMSGHEVLRALRADPELASVRAVALSGEAPGGPDGPGFEHWLLKPVDFSELRALLDGLRGGTEDPPEPSGPGRA